MQFSILTKDEEQDLSSKEIAPPFSGALFCVKVEFVMLKVPDLSLESVISLVSST